MEAQEGERWKPEFGFLLTANGVCSQRKPRTQGRRGRDCHITGESPKVKDGSRGQRGEGMKMMLFTFFWIGGEKRGCSEDPRTSS